jgi:hypothetical protein
MVYAALVVGDNHQFAAHRSFHSGDYSCLLIGLRFPGAGAAEAWEWLV